MFFRCEVSMIRWDWRTTRPIWIHQPSEIEYKDLNFHFSLHICCNILRLSHWISSLKSPTPSSLVATFRMPQGLITPEGSPTRSVLLLVSGHSEIGRIKRGRGTQVFPEGQACVITCWRLTTNSNGTSPFYLGKTSSKGTLFISIC